MKKFNLEEFLNEFGESTKKKIIDKIVKENVIKTGNLYDSINYDVKESGNSHSIEFSMIDYGKYPDEGTRYITPRHFFDKIINDSINDNLDKLLDEALKKELEKIFK